MDKILDRLSFSDFAAYFFPGFFFLIGLIPLLLQTPAGSSIRAWLNEPSLAVMAALLVLAFACGAIVSGLASLLVALLYAGARRRNTWRDPRAQVLPAAFEPEIRSEFASLFGGQQVDATWRTDNFLLARSYVEQHLPQLAGLARRQNALRALRENMALSSLVWIASAFLWLPRVTPPGRWGLLLAALSSLLLVPTTLVYRAHKNRAREVREIYLALLVARARPVAGLQAGAGPDQS